MKIFAFSLINVYVKISRNTSSQLPLMRPPVCPLLLSSQVSTAWYGNLSPTGVTHNPIKGEKGEPNLQIRTWIKLRTDWIRNRPFSWLLFILFLFLFLFFLSLFARNDRCHQFFMKFYAWEWGANASRGGFFR